MNAKQRNKMVSVLVEHQCEFGGLTTAEADWVIKNPKDAILVMVKAIKNYQVDLFPVWKTIQFGTGLNSADDFRQALKGAGCNISNWANDILGKPDFTVAEEKKELNLVIKSVRDLGFPKGATTRQIYERATSQGLGLCPAEVGPQLRLQYTDQPKGEWLLIAMEPIKDSDGDPVVFAVGRRDGGDFWLGTVYDDPGLVWIPCCRWVFAARK